MALAGWRCGDTMALGGKCDSSDVGENRLRNQESKISAPTLPFTPPPLVLYFYHKIVSCLGGCVGTILSLWVRVIVVVIYTVGKIVSGGI
mgnify:CR=1 FL=1